MLPEGVFRYGDAVALRILYIGEIIGRVGIFAVKTLLPILRQEYKPDLVVGCANGTTGGSGVGKAHAMYLHKLGINVLTTGEAAFFKKDIVEVFPKSPWLLRPLNYPDEVPGQGVRVAQTANGAVAIVQILGQAGFTRVHLDNPFRRIDDVMQRLRQTAPVVLVDFRAPTTAEKRAMIRHLDGRASAVVGSYGRALTADATVSAAGTASITDAGRTGSLVSVGGMDAPTRIREYLSGVPVWAKDAVTAPELQGCLIECDTAGRASSIRTLRVPCKEEFREGTGNSDKD